MPLVLVPKVRTQSLGWRCQEVHRYANEVASLPIVQVYDRARVVTVMPNYNTVYPDESSLCHWPDCIDC